MNPSRHQQYETVFDARVGDCPYEQVASEIVVTAGNLVHRFPESANRSIAVILRNYRDWRQVSPILVRALDEMGADYQFDASGQSLFIDAADSTPAGAVGVGDIAKRIWIRFLNASNRNERYRLQGVQLDACVFFPSIHISLDLKQALQIAEASMRLVRKRQYAPATA